MGFVRAFATLMPQTSDLRTILPRPSAHQFGECGFAGIALSASLRRDGMTGIVRAGSALPLTAEFDGGWFAVTGLGFGSSDDPKGELGVVPAGVTNDGFRSMNPGSVAAYQLNLSHVPDGDPHQRQRWR